MIFFISFLLIFSGWLQKGYTLSDSRQETDKILSQEEWGKYQELKEINAKLKEISMKYWQAVGPKCDVEHPENKEQAQQYREEIEKYDKVREEKEKEFWEKIAHQKEKIFLLAIEIDKVDTESAGWIFTKGFGDMKTNPRIFLEYYLYHNKFKDIEPKDYREYLAEGLDSYIQNMDFNQEKNNINEGLKFLADPQNSNEHKRIILQFLWDVWNGFFPRVEKMENKKEIYEGMNQQVISIIETLNSAKRDTELLEEVDKVLQDFQTHYSRNDLPVEFLQSPSISTIREKLTQPMKEN